MLGESRWAWPAAWRLQVSIACEGWLGHLKGGRHGDDNTETLELAAGAEIEVRDLGGARRSGSELGVRTCPLEPRTTSGHHAGLAQAGRRCKRQFDVRAGKAGRHATSLGFGQRRKRI